MKSSGLILIVEHNADDVLLMQRCFSKHLPNPLAFVLSGQEARSYLLGENSFSNRDQHPLPSLAIVDLGLPDKQAFELLQWIENNYPVPLITTGTSRRKEEIQQAFDLGANAYFDKPVDLNDLARMISCLELVNEIFPRAA